jgi:hypothetical protein
MATTKKPNVEISAGALVVVEIDGAQRRFNCTGATRPGRSHEKVIKDIQDCVRSSIAKATKEAKKKTK